MFDSLSIFLVMAVLLLGAAAVVSSLDTRLRRAIRRAPRFTTQTFVDGTIGKIAGRVKCPGEPLHAPLSGRPCVYYEVVVEAHRAGGRTGVWRELIRESKARDFVIEDEAGVAWVVMRGAEVAVVKEAHHRAGTLEDPTPELEAFLVKHGTPSKGFIHDRKYRYLESVVEPGEEVMICGFGAREPDPDPAQVTGGYRDNALRLVLTGGHATPLYITDDPLMIQATEARTSSERAR